MANRPTKEPRVLKAMAPEVRESYLKIRHEIDSTGSGPIATDGFKSAMAFEKAFVEGGGNLGAGVDPTGLGGALAGYGDQRNYELFIEAGFAPAQAIRIMTLNGAKILGVQQRLGSAEPGKLADLVVLKGDLTRDPTVIRNPTARVQGRDWVRLRQAGRLGGGTCRHRLSRRKHWRTDGNRGGDSG